MGRYAFFIFMLLASTAAYGQQTPASSPKPPVDASSDTLPSRKTTQVRATGKADPDTCVVGGTVLYTLRISWTSPRGSFVLLSPFEPPRVQGLDLMGQSQKTRKRFVGGEEITTTVRSYRYRCAVQGEYWLGPVEVSYRLTNSDEEGSAVAAAVSITVRPSLFARVRGSKTGRFGVFFGGLLGFWLLVFLGRRAFAGRRARRETPAKDGENQGEGFNSWDDLSEAARTSPGGAFYQGLEGLVWREVFKPDSVAAGAAATRIAVLAGRGVPVTTLNELRKLINLCQVARHTAGASQGEALAALSQARKVVEQWPDHFRA